ncbi:hypothetical protein BJ684DRAFT_19390 [Piptocephalis cylindrospora]|uniref:DUF1640-domain-containing protein n=1 Tax=Piptocephalis cylindrospora TaxID=1907219 RepID=A0A4P9Y5Z0_9FUNG|nr:hypothetical protein BJ684DRAFT_19390 [Piptocephalis cylindrospora]|eukprot:RKP14182.1 hypothetical protein BJ684DRAFT_19390 [Piptocephalis cylindrospora]
MLSPTTRHVLSRIPQRFTRLQRYSAPSSQKPQHFDTYRLVKALEREGFDQKQSEAIMRCLSAVVNESIGQLTEEMVTKGEQERSAYTYKVDFAQLKSEIQMLERNDFSLVRQDTERLEGEIEKLKQKLREEITRTQSGVRLDMNLDKGRIRDEAGAQDVRINEAAIKVETEIGRLRTQMETIKFQILQYMIGTITGTGALILAYLRMFK